MKKIIVLGMVIVMLFCTAIPAFADAAYWGEEPADYYVYVATPDGGLNLREGPGTEYPTVLNYRIPDGTKLYIEWQTDNWGFTEYEGEHGWVSLKQTSETPPASQKETPVDYYVYVATPDGGLNLREKPTEKSATVINYRIPDGTKLHIQLKSGNWGYTEYDGEYGWVALKQTSQTPPVVNDDKPETTQSGTSSATELTESDDVLAEENYEDEYYEEEEYYEEASSSTDMFVLIGIIVGVVVIAAVVIILVINKKSKAKKGYNGYEGYEG